MIEKNCRHCFAHHSRLTLLQNSLHWSCHVNMHVGAAEGGMDNGLQAQCEGDFTEGALAGRFNC